MLRVLVVAIGVACLIGAAFLAHLAWFAALELGIFGALILASTFFEKHYRERRIGGSGFQKTDERFVDPTSGKLVEVQYDPSTGERAYVDPGRG